MECDRAGAEALLPERIGAGERLAEDEFVRLFQRRVFLMALVRTRDREAAQDIAQEVMVGVLRALREGRLADPAHLPGYVYGTARNLINNYLRRLRRRPPGEPVPEDLPAPASGGDVERSELVLLARRALSQVSAGDRLILLLTLVDGLKPGEIAARLGLSPEVARKRKSRAVERVRRAFDMVSRS